MTLKNPSRARANRFGINSVPYALIPTAATIVSWLGSSLFLFLIGFQLYFILHGSGSFEYDPEGDEEYETFWGDRWEEMGALGPASKSRLYGYLNAEVFGNKQRGPTAEMAQQTAFSQQRLKEIKAQALLEGAAKEDAEEEAVEEDDVDGHQGGGDPQAESSRQGRGEN